MAKKDDPSRGFLSGLFSFASARRKILAVIVVAILAATSIVIIHPWESVSNAPLKTASFGPKLAINVLGDSNGSSGSPVGNNTTITVQVSSIVPSMLTGEWGSANLSGIDPSNNSYYVNLLNTTINSTHTSLFLSPLFMTMASQWRAKFSSESGRNFPSLSIEALKTVYENRSIEIYSYYNNLEYDPYSVPYESVQDGYSGSMNLTQWFNNTGIDPSMFSEINMVDLSFSVNLSFPGTPIQVIHNVTNSSFRAQQSNTSTPAVYYPASCSGKGSYTTTYWGYSYETSDTAVHTNFTIGYLPLIMVHFGRGTANGLSAIALSASLLILNDTIGFTSAESYVPTSGEVSTSMSSGPSYSHAANVTFTGSTNEFAALPSPPYSVNRTTAFVAIDNATYEFTYYRQYTYEYYNEYQRTTYYEYVPFYYDGHEYCREVIYATSTVILQSDYVGRTLDGTGSSGEIANIASTGNIRLSAGFLPIEVNMVLQKVIENSDPVNLTLAASGTMASYSSSTVWADAYGFSSAAGVIQTTAHAVDVFSTSIALGLAVTDSLAAISMLHDASEPSIVALSLGMISAATGLSGNLPGTLSTISFVGGSNVGGMFCGFSSNVLKNHGSNYSVSMYTSSSLIRLSANGNTYTFYAPEDYFNVTSITSIESGSASLQVSSPSNSSQSSPAWVYQTSGMWSIGNAQQDTAVYNIPSGSRYMSGSVFNEWQDFAFEPGQVSVSSGQYAGYDYAVGTVFVNLTDSQGNTVASWSHTFNYFSTVDPQYVYVNPMFSIPSGSPSPLTGSSSPTGSEAWTPQSDSSHISALTVQV